MGNVISIIVFLGIFAFITWQVVGIVKDIRRKISEKKCKQTSENEVEREDNDISISRGCSEDNQSLEE